MAAAQLQSLPLFNASAYASREHGWRCAMSWRVYGKRTPWKGSESAAACQLRLAHILQQQDVACSAQDA